MLPCIQCCENSKFGGQKKQAGVNVILNDSPTQVFFRQIAGHQFPVPASIITLDHDGAVVTHLVNIQARINRIRVVQVSLDVIHKKRFWYVKDAVNFSPCPTTIFTDLYQTIIGSNVQQTFDQRRFVNRCDIAILTHCIQIIGTINAVNAAHGGQLIAILVPRQIRRDFFPTVTSIITSMQELGSKIKTLVVMGTDQDG